MNKVYTLLISVLLANGAVATELASKWFQAEELLPLPRTVTTRVDTSNLSDEAKASLGFLYQDREIKLFGGFPAKGEDLEEWRAARKVNEAFGNDISAKAAQQFPVKTIKHYFGDVLVLEVTPAAGVTQENDLVYLHGGAFVINNAENQMHNVAPLICESGHRCYVIDYTLVPEAKSEAIMTQVMTAIKGIGPVENQILFGDSAGANLAVAATHKLQEAQLGRPKALVLWSPWLDASCSGKSAELLDSVDPLLSADMLRLVGSMYAAPGVAVDHPSVSPLFADVPADFPPTIMIAGTNDILRSDADRFAEKLHSAGVRYNYAVFPHLQHVFTGCSFEFPESKLAREMTIKFIQ
jgi:acetyl esterase/lipase